MKLRVRRINSKAIVPRYAHISDAGMDLYSVDDCIINPQEVKLIHTGIEIELPQETEAQIRPRSGLALKNGLTVLNTPGTIDEGYRGEIGIILINHGNNPFHVEVGTKIAQMVIKPVLKVDIEEVKNLAVSDRGENGFGSTGTK